MADVDGPLHRGGHRNRGGHGDVDAPRIREQPFVAEVVDAGNHPADPEFGLRQQRHRDVRVVVTGRRDDDIADLQLGLFKRRQLASVRE
jgi:hypothetical protein